MIGRNIPIPHLYGNFSAASNMNTPLLNAANIATGGDFFAPSLFSLGLGPWMGAAILWRFLMIDRFARKRKWSQKATNYARAALMVVLAGFQGISLMSNYEIRPLTISPFTDPIYAQIMILAVMVTGSLVVVWLANRNQEKGFGGMTMFILYQIIISSMRNFTNLSGYILAPQYRRTVILIAVTCVIIVIVTVLAANVELRLHVNKIAIDSGYIHKSYLPIKVNPGGAAPVMYALTLIMIPQYIVHALSLLFPAGTTGITHFFSHLLLSDPIGFNIYLVLLFVLTIFFGLFTVNPKDISDQMKDSGDYFDGIAPGGPTKRHIRIRVVVLSIISGVILVVLTGFPLYFLEVDQTLSYLYIFPATVMMYVSLLMVIKEEISDLIISTKYTPLF